MKLLKEPMYVMVLLSLLSVSCMEKKDKDKAHKEGTTKMEEEQTTRIDLELDDAQKRVAVKINGQLFTRYVYDGQTPKPILYPLLTKSGKTVTRGFPYDPRPFERIDHPHHAGQWFNYGDVNGLDFWNNSYAIPEEQKHKYGTIVHQEILRSDADAGTLRIKAIWRSPDAKDLLEETTEFTFSEEGDTRIIDRSTTLRALEEVSFTDNKEGMIAVRVARELELPSDKPAAYTDAEGNVTEVQALNNDGVNGNYYGSEGATGNAVWGTRNKWVKLEGEIDGETVSITIMDHKRNVGYPTYWHARGYGLFAANPLGQAIFSKGKERLDFILEKDKSVTFNYRILVHSGSVLSEEELGRSFDDFNL